MDNDKTFRNKTMPRLTSPPIEQFLSSLLGRTILVSLTVVVVAAALMLVYLVKLDFALGPLNFLIQAGLGLASGLVARFLLRGSIRALQLAAALAAMILGQIVIGAVSLGVLGLQRSPGRFFGASGWAATWQILWSGLVTLLVTLAWNHHTGSRTSQGRGNTVRQGRERQGKTEAGKPQPARKVDRRSQPGLLVRRRSGSPVKMRKDKDLKVPANGTGARGNPLGVKVLSSGWRKVPGQVWKNIQERYSLEKRIEVLTQWAAGISGWFARVLGKQGHRATPRVRLGRGNLGDITAQKNFGSRSSAAIKLVGEEEHICPYCLETVVPNDPRGLRKCPFCKTWHHGDCWAEVGECQVPHYQK
jgi:ribosomal protein L37AE/L43A